MSDRERWLDPPESVMLEPGDLHIWRVWLDQQPPAHLEDLRTLLSSDEKERAARFHFAHHRERYVVGRGTLRILLGRYLSRPPQSLNFAYGDQGKPMMVNNQALPSLEFNIAHSEHVALMAFIHDRPVGVDVERIRPLKDMRQMAARFFSNIEFETWQSVPDEQKDQAFFNCWTRKEAYIKVIGEGLTHPLNRFVVSLKPEENGRLLAVDGSQKKAKRWRMQALHPTRNFAAAVVVEGGWQRLRCWYYHA